MHLEKDDIFLGFTDGKIAIFKLSEVTLTAVLDGHNG